MPTTINKAPATILIYLEGTVKANVLPIATEMTVVIDIPIITPK
jgi:hypothetical protein